MNKPAGRQLKILVRESQKVERPSDDAPVKRIDAKLLQNRAKWRDSFTELQKEGGFYEELGEHHKALYTQRGNTLVVTFENLDDHRQNADDRMPWGVNYITSRGWSSLGLMCHGPTWYRAPEVWDFFDRLRDEKFFDQFNRVVFYGGSMGGYGASAFSAACPGADVIAVAPQATMDRDITLGWENRFRMVWGADFKGRYGNGAEMCKTANRVLVFYDPMVREDAMHASLYTGDNVTKIRCRYLGHHVMTAWKHMGILDSVISGCIRETLSANEIYKLLAGRKTTHYYQKLMLNHLIKKQRPYLIYTYCRAVVQRALPDGRPHFERAMHNAAKAMGLPSTPTR